MRFVDRWLPRWRTVRAMLLLCAARLLVACAPLRWWRARLGLGGALVANADRREARLLARHVERAADHLPFAFSCLPRAIALSRMLRRARLPHALVIGVRPISERRGADDLHAWVEMAGERLIGDLPGPWIVTFRAGAR